jgi:hypothetical protein
MLERLLITAAAAWYLAYCVTSTHGAFGMFKTLRQRLPLGGLTSCIICLIFWLALIIGYLQGLTIIESVAAAGVALWFHGYSGWRLNL